MQGEMQGNIKVSIQFSVLFLKIIIQSNVLKATVIQVSATYLAR